MQSVKLDDILDTNLITVMGADADIKNKKLCSSFVAEQKEVVTYVKHDVLVRTTGMKDKSRQHLGSEVRRWWRVVSLIDCAAGVIHGMCGPHSHTPQNKALLYHRRCLEVLYSMARVMRKFLSSCKDVHG